MNASTIPTALKSTLLLIVLVLFGPGCSVLEEDLTDIDPIERAQRINDELEEGDREFDELSETYDPQTRPEEIAELLEAFEEGPLDHYKTALDLDLSAGSSPSARPRIKYAAALSFAAALHRDQAFYLDADVRERDGDSAELESKIEGHVERQRELARQSVRHFKHYSGIARQYPYPNWQLLMAKSYSLAGDFELAAQSLERFVEEENLRPESEKNILALAKRYREQAVDLDQ